MKAVTGSRKRFGQHFLEPAWISKLINVIDVNTADVFLEIGAGRGGLTAALAKRARHITAVEIDPRLVEGLSSRMPINVSVVKADFLGLELTELSFSNTPVRIVGNLPYNVGTPILIKVLNSTNNGKRFHDATLMLQREVAERVTATPGSPNWGPLAVATQVHADAQCVLNLPPGAFRPVPRVRSAVVHLLFRPSPIPITDPGFFDLFVRTLFTQRRKTALNALRFFAPKVSRLTAKEVFLLAGIDGSRRPGDLNLAELAELSEVLSSSRL